MKGRIEELFKKKWFMWITLFTIPFVGVYLAWKYKMYNIWVRILITLIFIGYVAVYVNLQSKQQETTNTELNEKVPIVSADFKKYMEDTYAGKADWLKLIDHYEVVLNTNRSGMHCTFNIYTTLTEKNGKEEEIANGVMGFFNAERKTKYGYSTGNVYVFDKQSKLLVRKNKNF